MAYFGLSKPYIAKLNVEAGMYSDGFRCGEAVGTEVTPNYNEAFLHGDNRLVEYVKEFKDADVTVTVTTLPIKAAETMFGHTVDEEKKSITYNVNDAANYVGYGFCVQEMKDGIVTYPAVWMPKVKFADSAESLTTKGESITFGTPSISGKAAADAQGNWRYKQTFATEAEADAWLQEKANIKASEEDAIK